MALCVYESDDAVIAIFHGLLRKLKTLDDKLEMPMEILGRLVG